MGNYFVEKRCSAEILMITPLGILLISSVGDFDELRWGIERTSLGMIFPLQLAEDSNFSSADGR